MSADPRAGLPASDGPNLGKGAEYDRDAFLALLEDFDGAPYPDEVQRAFRLRMETVLHDLEVAYAVLVFADGAVLNNTGSLVLADLYNDTCEPARILRQAGTWPRGSFNRNEPHCWEPREDGSCEVCDRGEGAVLHAVWSAANPIEATGG